MNTDTLEKIYAGFLGKCFGVRLGAPVEPQIWNYKNIREIYGDIDHYTKYYKTFAADDDTNGPLFFHRMLLQNKENKSVQAKDVANAWLNFARENIGMFWWGGNNISTEHTAYLNLLNGIEAPQSGSSAQNGTLLAEQIGGQIFIDTWGLLYPGNPDKAVYAAECAASVSHDGDGLEGAKFITSCISLAFSSNNIDEVIEKSLQYVSIESNYYKVVKAVIDFYEKEPNNWYECMEYLDESWGYDKFGGVCHIIPNAGVCILSMLYGKGDFSRTIEIATMCGWDTDCNAGNVGTILGVMVGVKGLPRKYRNPTNDMIIASSVVGQLNIVDVPTFAYETAQLSCQLNDEAVPGFLSKDYQLGKIDYDFSLPGSTHGFKSDNYFKTELSHVSTSDSKGALGILIDRMVSGEVSHIYNKPFYRRKDFSDERYKPCFTPQVFSGDRVEIDVFFECWNGVNCILQPYVRDTFSERRIYLDTIELTDNEHTHISFEVPDMKGSFVDEVGFAIVTDSPLLNRLFGRVSIEHFLVTPKPVYSIDFSKQAVEFMNVTPFTCNRGQQTIDHDVLVFESENSANCFSGSYYEKDIILECQYTPIFGWNQKIIFKARGIRQYYAIGFNGPDKISLDEVDFKRKTLTETEHHWVENKEYKLKLKCIDTKCELYIDDERVLVCDEVNPDIGGMFGFEIQGDGKSEIRGIKINL